MARNTARLTQPVHRGQGFLQTRLGTCAMQDLEETLERLFQTAWSLQPGPVRIQIFSELEQFRIRIAKTS